MGTFAVSAAHAPKWDLEYVVQCVVDYNNTYMKVIQVFSEAGTDWSGKLKNRSSSASRPSNCISRRPVHPPRNIFGLADLTPKEPKRRAPSRPSTELMESYRPCSSRNGATPTGAPFTGVRLAFHLLGGRVFSGGVSKPSFPAKLHKQGVVVVGGCLGPRAHTCPPQLQNEAL